MFRLLLPLISLGLVGCVTLPAVSAGSGAAGYIIASFTVINDTDQVIAGLKPIDVVVCGFEEAGKHSEEAQVAIKAACDNLPNDIIGVDKQILAVVEALDAYHRGKTHE